MMAAPYSYRSDPDVPKFDDSAPLIIFDGMCVLCSTGVMWVMARDPDGNSKFAAIQEPVPKALYRHYGLNAEAFDTFMVLNDGIPFTKWAGVLAVGKTLPHPWRFLSSIARLVPDFVGDRFYDWVQRNRLSWFGSRDTCLVPDAKLSRRFLNRDAAEGSNA